jgi:hypothetical protein
MSPRISRPLWLFSVAVVTLWSSWGTEADGQTRPHTLVAIGALGSTVPGARATTRLHEAIRRQLKTVSGVREAPRTRARYILEGSVTRLERRRAQGGTEVKCEVSLLLSEKTGGSVRALLDGRAGATGEGPTERLESAALQGAVRGALRRLPGAIESTSQRLRSRRTR